MFLLPHPLSLRYLYTEICIVIPSTYPQTVTELYQRVFYTRSDHPDTFAGSTDAAPFETRDGVTRKLMLGV